MVKIFFSSSVIMSNELLRLFSSYITLTILLLCFTQRCRAENSSSCSTSTCGNINISFPFRLRGDPANCGHPDPFFALDCQKNQPTLLTKTRKYHVQAITYSNYSTRISDPGLDSNNYSSCPVYSYEDDEISSSYVYRSSEYNINMAYVNCLSPVTNPLYIKNLCGNTTAFSNSSRIYSYVTTESILVPDLEDSCTYDSRVQSSSRQFLTDQNYSYEQIHDRIAYGFELGWYRALCKDCPGSQGECNLEGHKITCRHYCYESTPFEERTFFCKLEYYAGYLFYTALAIGSLITLRFILGLTCIIVFIKKKSKRQSSFVEELMREQVNHMPINYSYKEIKKMTQNFKAKIGKTVFKGNLRSGPLAAIKMVTNSSSNNKEFINHAIAISNISHANVVKLYGFCIHGSKRALVHEFLQRGSLHQHMHMHMHMQRDLSLREMFKIAVGLARGIQCLHAAKIIHLAIRPQCILLDEDLNPKISDSGPHDDNDTSSTTAKAMGFMAPELVYKNVGEVSCKADVYSYGMVVLEMAARRWSLNMAGELGQVYFPLWIYSQLCEGKELEMGGGDEEEKEMMRKMIVAGLWCIQIRSGDRPMMDEVIGMLQGECELLQMPPLPFQTAISYDQELVL